jgi:hypothetical protein
VSERRIKDKADSKKNGMKNKWTRARKMREGTERREEGTIICDAPPYCPVETHGCSAEK